MGIRVLELNVHSVVIDRNDKIVMQTISCQVVNTDKLGFSHLDWFLGASMGIYQTINWETKYFRNVILTPTYMFHDIKFFMA